ncbi:Cobyrinic acid ac-diamide synthase [Xylanimonas cellulosilytica DSM 15894]|uniref:Cobyrinic acid ac-diamide synthase n=2 Tax=Xylanimonas TaxID=186188 RepID=D1BRV6_XYLCX|nr:Cobyrinic acid ac-diamide synthase [Xylanimonas cellulosilytica DSM 15894]
MAERTVLSETGWVAPIASTPVTVTQPLGTLTTPSMPMTESSGVSTESGDDVVSSDAASSASGGLDSSVATTVAEFPAPSLEPSAGTSPILPGRETQRAALIDSIPQTDDDDDTPLAAQLAVDARRRIDLHGRKFPRPEQTRILTVANQKGGVGKTTTTVNLAAGLAQAGLNVLVIDNDPQGNASTALGIEHRAGTQSIYEVLVEGAPLSSAVQACPDVPGLWAVPATIDLSGAEIELVSLVSRETRLRRALDRYLEERIENGEERIDYVLVDCPPSLGLLTVNAFVVGREVLIPIQCEYYALEGLSQLLKTIELIRAHLNPELTVSTILLTMYDGRTNLAQQVAEEVRTHFPEQTLRTTVPRSVRISEAPSHGQTVMTYDPSSTGALAYLEAAREVADRHAQRADLRERA